MLSFSNLLLIIYPVTSNVSAWTTSSGLFAVLLLLAGFAFYTSLGGRKVFDSNLPEE
jgi:hypothetical protein